MALSAETAASLATELRRAHLEEMPRLDRLYGYVRGQNGIPTLPETAADELQQIARMSVKNVMTLVVNSFAQNLSVIGYRAATAQQNLAAWRLWQSQRMDARQSEAHRPALTYGASYVTVLPGDDGSPLFRPRSPRQVIAVYEDPHTDAWPLYALETWKATENGKRRLKGALIDDEMVHPLDFGELARDSVNALVRKDAVTVGEARPHGAVLRGRGVCPVVRFVNDRDADDTIVGEVEPLIVLQKAINNVNFDRLVVSRFGAFPQKVITGWSGTKEEVLRASASQVWTFEDENVKAFAMQAGTVEGYNALLDEMMEHVAMVAQISPAQVTGKMINVSAEALAAAEANQQRKLVAKRESFGESWEQVLQLGASMAGDELTAGDIEAEVIWRDTEARSFGAVVDGVQKLSSAGIPIDLLLPMVPGLSQVQIQAIRDRLAGSADIVAALQELSARNG